MDLFESPVEAGDAIRRFLFTGQVPDIVRERIEPLVSARASEVTIAKQFVESVYANRDDVPAEALAIAAACAMMIHSYNWMPAGRAIALVPVLRRESGEKAPAGVPWPKKADDPEADPQYLPPAPIAPAQAEAATDAG